VIAIEAAIKGQARDDFYVTDLWDIFRSVQERSKYKESVWRDPRSNREFPTPFAYLLYEITADLRDLSSTAVREAASKPELLETEKYGRPGRDLVLTWSLCISSIADSGDQVSPEFRHDAIRQYLLFVLALGWQPNEVSPGLGNDDCDFDEWRDLFLRDLKARFRSPNDVEREALKNAFESLDRGKYFVLEGYDWLENELFR
jgi:hypothetical protein